MKIMIVAGEASGDKHAADLVRSIRSKTGDDSVEFFGSAGPSMRQQGVEAVVRADDLSIVGVAEIAMALPLFVRTFRTLVRLASEREPDVVILVDFPEFNLKLARSLKKKGLRVVYYISPQLWAWRKYRVETVKRYVDLMLTILPFEKAWYSQHGYENAVYVGNPLANKVIPTMDTSEFRALNAIDARSPLVALLPGSRHKEIVRILPVMLEAARCVRAKRPNVRFIVPVRSGRNEDDARRIITGFGDRESIFRVVADKTYEAVAASDVAVVTSGTATLETGLLGIPMIIGYKTSKLNYALLKPLISIEHFGLVNLIAGERVGTELLQDEFRPDAVCSEVLRLLDPAANQAARAKLRAVKEKLGPAGASDMAADAILDLIETHAGLKVGEKL